MNLIKQSSTASRRFAPSNVQILSSADFIGLGCLVELLRIERLHSIELYGKKIVSVDM